MTIDNTVTGSHYGSGAYLGWYKRFGLYHVPAGYWDGFIENPTSEDWRNSQELTMVSNRQYQRVSFGRAFFGDNGPIEFTLQFYNFTNETVITGPEYKWHATDSWPIENNDSFRIYYSGTPHAWWHALGGSVTLAPGQSTFRTFRYYPAESLNDYQTAETFHDLWRSNPESTDWGTAKTPCVELFAHFNRFRPNLTPLYNNEEIVLRDSWNDVFYDPVDGAYPAWITMTAFQADSIFDSVGNLTGTAEFSFAPWGDLLYAVENSSADDVAWLALDSEIWPNADARPDYSHTAFGYDENDVVVSTYFWLSIGIGSTFVDYDLAGTGRLSSENSSAVLQAYVYVQATGQVTGGGYLGTQAAYPSLRWFTPFDGDVILPAPNVSNPRIERDGIVVTEVPFYDESHIEFLFDQEGRSLESSGLRSVDPDKNNLKLEGHHKSVIPQMSWHKRTAYTTTTFAQDPGIDGIAGPSQLYSSIDSSGQLQNHFHYERVGKPGGIYFSYLPPYTDIELYTGIDSRNGYDFGGRRGNLASFTSGGRSFIYSAGSDFLRPSGGGSLNHYSHWVTVGASCELTRPILIRTTTGQLTDEQGVPVAITQAANNVAVLNEQGNFTGAIIGVSDGVPVQLEYRFTNIGGATATAISKPNVYSGSLSANVLAAQNTYNSIFFVTNNAIAPNGSGVAYLTWTPRKAGTFANSYSYGDLFYQWSRQTNAIGEDVEEIAGHAIVRGNLLGKIFYGFEDFPELGNSIYEVSPSGYRASPYPPANYTYIITTVKQILDFVAGGWNVGAIPLGIGWSVGGPT